MVVRRLGIDVPTERLADFCRKWKVMELALFGSVLGKISRRKATSM